MRQGAAPIPRSKLQHFQRWIARKCAPPNPSRNLTPHWLGATRFGRNKCGLVAQSGLNSPKEPVPVVTTGTLSLSSRAAQRCQSRARSGKTSPLIMCATSACTRANSKCARRFSGSGFVRASSASVSARTRSQNALVFMPQRSQSLRTARHRSAATTNCSVAGLRG